MSEVEEQPQGEERKPEAPVRPGQPAPPPADKQEPAPPPAGPTEPHGEISHGEEWEREDGW